MAADNNTLDAALAQVHGYSSVLTNNLSNHIPMVAEALNHMGLEDAILPWANREMAFCRTKPPLGQLITPDAWQEALTDPQRYSDWVAFFSREIDDLGWAATLQIWVGHLTPGFASAAAHGVIRVGHAARGLADYQSQVRLQELAHALAAWASAYETLAYDKTPQSGLSPSKALAALPLVGAEQHSPAGSISDALAALADDSNFGAHFLALDTDDDLDQLTLDCAATFARLFCQSARNPLTAIVFTHAITGMGAVRNLSPYLLPEQHEDLIRHAFHSGCALHMVYSNHPYTPPLEDPMPLEAPECVYDALAHGDEHVIKLIDVCVNFTRATADSFFLSAAEQCRRLLPPMKPT